VTLRFTIPGTPVPKGRPRFVRMGKGRNQQVRAITPRETVAYEAHVKACAAAAGIATPVEGSFRLTLDVYLPDARVRDGENIQKAIQDALNGCAWVDDSQVREWVGRLRIDRQQPRVEVLIEPIETPAGFPLVPNRKKPKATGATPKPRAPRPAKTVGKARVASAVEVNRKPGGEP
jgi:Holliday junction resolvase RusA-like endonuclease